MEILLRISTKGRYSLEAVLFLALNSKDEHISAREVAEQTGISEGYLEQLFIPLRKAGIIHSERGAQGGYTLKKSASQISAGEVLRSVEASLKPAPCVDEKYCPKEDDCTSHATWRDLYNAITECIDSVSIADLVKDYKTNIGAEYTI
ncbi:MAG: Rrf2 family transcriptional regulator [Termitinemataceae bacterium]|nr:MAG: Rrf2 family transcriptional regulator [Termitinemataceae bacterium]